MVFLALSLGLDRLMLSVEPGPGLAGQVQVFYRDFRSKLLNLPGPKAPEPSIERIIEQTNPPAAKAPAARAAAPLPSAGQKTRYIYTDEAGQIVFADSLEEVPRAQRKEARAMDVDP